MFSKQPQEIVQQARSVLAAAAARKKEKEKSACRIVDADGFELQQTAKRNKRAVKQQEALLFAAPAAPKSEPGYYANAAYSKKRAHREELQTLLARFEEDKAKSKQLAAAKTDA